MLRSVQDDFRLIPDAPAVIVERWTRDFRFYRERIEQSGLDLWMDLPSRLARVGVHPFISREDIDHRRARGWSIDTIGTVLDALATETYRSDHVPEAKLLASFARALFDAMAERSPCPLAELIASMTRPRTSA
jgi:hypothetical protein